MPEENTNGSPQGTGSVPGTGTSFDFKPEIDHYVAQAAGINKSDVMVCRANTDVMAANIRAGVASVTQQEILERIQRELPTVDLGPIKDLTRLGETVAHAARMVTPTVKPAQVGEAVTRGKEIRASFFNQIEVLVDAGIVKPEEYEPMKKGKGTVSLANDLIDAAALFKRHESETTNKITITPQLIAEGRELGVYLREHVAPASAVKTQSADKSSAAETRDLLWTLLVRRHQELRRVAAWIWLDEADKHVPPLRAYQRKRKSQEQQAEVGTKGSTEDSTEGVPA